jgi:hypothetical protein
MKGRAEVPRGVPSTEGAAGACDQLVRRPWQPGVRALRPLGIKLASAAGRHEEGRRDGANKRGNYSILSGALRL